MSFFRKYPIIAQSVSAGALFAIGDCIAQHGIEKTNNHDINRTFRLSLFGTFVAGPSIALWYRFLSANVKMSSPLKTLCAKVCLDQFVFSPVSIAVFFTANSLMEGKKYDEIKLKLKKTYTTALLNNWKLWPAVQFINFSIVPVNYQSIVVNTVALGWNSYMSSLNKSASYP